MKKALKNISRVVFLLLLIVSIFGTLNVLAEKVIFKITKIEVKEKSNKVTIENVNLNNNTITNNVTFYELNDYIKYNITIKNNSNDDYIIESISDDNLSQYLSYSYDDLSNEVIKAGDEKVIQLKITYSSASDIANIQTGEVNLYVTYKDKNENKEINNPKTGDNITLYMILGIISLTGLVITTVSKKHLSKSLMVVGLFSVITIPLGVKANSDKFAIKFINEIKLKEYDVTFKTSDGEILSTKSIINGRKIASEVLPVKDGYKCNAWKLDGDTFNFNEDVNDSMILTCDFERIYPTISLNMDSEYYLGTNFKLTSTYTSATTDNTIEYYYGHIDKENEYIGLTNINNIREVGKYKITAKITDNLGAVSTATTIIDITGPDLNIKYSDNKTDKHYYNYDITLSGEASNCESPIIDYKFYITKSHVEHAYNESGISISNEIVYDDNYEIVENLIGFEAGYYKIKVVAKDERGYEFTKEEITQIEYSSFDFATGFTNDVITKTNVASIHFVDGVTIDLNNNTNYRDISSNNDGGVIEWWEETSEGSGMYNIYIGGQYSHYVQSSSQDLTNLFSGYSNCTLIDLSYLSTVNATSMKMMFHNDKKLTKIFFGDKFDTSTVANFDSMFNQTNSLTAIDTSVFDVSSAHCLYAMFAYATALKKLDLSSWDVSQVVNLNSIFMHLEKIEELDVSTWDTSNVTDMGYMFYKAWGSKIYNVDMSNWTFKSEVKVNNMFDEASRIKTTINIKNPVGNYTQMFHSSTTVNGSGITVNYTSDTESVVNSLIGTRSNTRVAKGSLIE